MLKDNIKNAQNFYALSKYIRLGLEYIEKTDFSALENGKYEILEDKVYAVVQDYMSKTKSEGKFEAHRKYIDIQYIVEGEELMGVGNINDFSEFAEYDDAKDIVFMNPKVQSMPDFFTLKKGEFVIFMPHDAHMPSIAIENPNPNPSYVKKVVVKVCT